MGIDLLRPREGVRLQGLKSRPELNGREGVLQHFVASKDRWAVEVNGEPGPMLFKLANMVPASRLSMEERSSRLTEESRQAIVRAAYSRWTARDT